MVGDLVYFTSNDGVHGVELWRTDGTPGGTKLVRDINPGSATSQPRAFVNVGGTLFFSANDGTHGQELWRTDGSEEGTVLVKDINQAMAPGGTGSSFLLPRAAALNGLLYFVATDGVRGLELWKSDGTGAGTVIVKDIAPGSGSSMILATGGPVVVNDMLYFVANDNASGLGHELWKSDGTAEGTTLVKDIYEGGSSFPTLVGELNGRLLFVAEDGLHGRELWSSDATLEGTQLLKDILSGSESSAVQSVTIVDDTAYFFADDGIHGRELWKSDGTSPGTILVHDIVPGATGSSGGQIGPWGQEILFAATDGVLGIELWTSDGTSASTRLFKDLATGPAASVPADFRGISTGFYFTALDPRRGRELWRSDGTPASTFQLPDIFTGPESSNPSFITILPSGQVVFTADDPIHGRELWILLETQHNTARPLDVNNDFATTAADALDVINWINAFGPTPAASASQTNQFYDVNADNQITAADALAIINHLNAFGPEQDADLPAGEPTTRPTSDKSVSGACLTDALLTLLALENASLCPIRRR